MAGEKKIRTKLQLVFLFINRRMYARQIIAPRFLTDALSPDSYIYVNRVV